MVARGDLGVETSVEVVPVYQKTNHRKSRQRGKDGNHGDANAAVDGDQSSADSRRSFRRCQRVWDGTDASMLSNETASGSYPVAAVETMCRIIESAEAGKGPESGSDYEMGR